LIPWRLGRREAAQADLLVVKLPVPAAVKTISQQRMMDFERMASPIGV
jgi:hypothetical protein